MKEKVMDKSLKKIMWFLMIFILPVALFAQKDVTQFLDIPVDGYKPEMIRKLKSKGYTIIRDSEDILEGEFNGKNVTIGIVTNNNKVWRIAVFDAYPTNESNIKIRFNNLIEQFVNNKRYSTETDSTIAEYIIPEDEDISYEMAVNNKRYQATFYQKSVKYDSLINEAAILVAKDTRNDKENDRFNALIEETLKATMNSLNKQVWFMIGEEYGKYRIMLFYDNEFNKANGEGL